METIQLQKNWMQDLVCPKCRETLKVYDYSMQCHSCGNTYPIIEGVPRFVPSELDEHQKAELDSVLSKHEHVVLSKNSLNEVTQTNPITPKWLEGKLDNTTVKPETRIVCLGGGKGDDVSHVKSNFKFNIDHLAHEYIKIFEDMSRTQYAEGTIKHVASGTENLPFQDNYADAVYSRNSIDHVSNPIKTLKEINRILKPEGKFFLSVFYNSNFVDCCETTSIDEDFVNNHLKKIFKVKWLEIGPIEQGHQPPKFALPQKRKLEWLHAVCEKKIDYEPYEASVLEEYGALTADFHTALYYDEILNPEQAAKFFFKVIERKPLLEADKMRILYAKIRYLSVTDHHAFKDFFDDFKQSNNDPFWWRIVILSSGAFMKKTLQEEIKARFSEEEQEYLQRSLNTLTSLSFKRFVKNRKTLYKLSKPIYNAVKPLMNNADFFERSVF